MLTVAFSLFIAFYVLGPDLIFRWVVAFYAPARLRKRSYGEQIAVACVLSVVPFSIAWELTRFIWDIYSPEHKITLAIFLDGILSATSFDKNAGAFYKALPYIWKINCFGIAIVYTIVVLAGWRMGRLIQNLGRVTRNLEHYPKLVNFINLLVKPWTAEWHLRLSPMLLPTESSFIQVEILTTMNILHRGNLVRHDLSSEGGLVSITLEKTERFRREEFTRLREKNKAGSPTLNPEDFWTQVPGDFYIIKAEQIATINVRYVDSAKGPDLSSLPLAFASMKKFVEDLERAQASQSEGPVEEGQPPKTGRRPTQRQLDLNSRSSKSLPSSRRRKAT